MSKYEDLVGQLREENPDLADEFESFSASALRKKAEERDAFERENAGLKADIAKRDAAPKIEQAFKSAGVDFGQLRPAEKAALAAVSVEDIGDPDKVAAFISQNELPLIEGQQGEGTEPPPAAAVVQAARQAPSGTSAAASGEVKLADYADWPIDKRMRFNEEHPQAAEAFKRGEEAVTGIVFT